jgi:hypothetical protein
MIYAPTEGATVPLSAPALRYALVGTGSRAQMYLDAMTGIHAPVCALVAWSDTNPGRLDVHERRLREAGAVPPVRFAPDAVAEAVREHRIGRVIVTTPDATHADVVVAALEAGADAVVEKPLMLRDVFVGAGEDPLGHAASWRDGVRSVVVGLAGNRSLETGNAVPVDRLDLGSAASLLTAGPRS